MKNSSVLLRNRENQCFGQLELAHRVILTPCHCDEEMKELRRRLRLKPRPQIEAKKIKIEGMGLSRILALASDPFAFIWDVRCTNNQACLNVVQFVVVVFKDFLLSTPNSKRKKNTKLLTDSEGMLFLFMLRQFLSLKI